MNSQCGRSPHLVIRTRTDVAASEGHRAHPCGAAGDDVLVAGADDARELVEHVGVEADQHARLPAQHAAQDDLGGALGRHLGEPLVEHPGRSYVVVLARQDTRPRRAMAVLMPPGWTTVTPTG